MRKILSLLTAILFAGSMMATLPENPQWEAKALADIADGSTLIIISNSTTATNVALPSTATTSNPAKKICEVTTAGGVTTITAPEGSSLQDLAWTLVKSGDNYKFYQEGSEEIRMYLTGLSTNTGLRIGNANSVNDEFVMGDLGQLLKVTTGTRFVGPYDNNGSDWRTYNTENATNYKGAALTFYVLKASQGGDDPQPETQTVYLNGGGSALWNQADAEFFAHTWGGAEAVAVKMTLVEGDVYSAAIPADNANVVFVRMAPESSAIDWDNCWNKTEDLTIEGENNLYTITAWGEGTKVCAGAWSVYGEGGGDTPEPPTPAEKDSIFFVNVSDWAAVRVHLWGGSADGTEWPGVEMTKEAEQINGHDVYKFVADEGAYANCIFSDKGNNQTGNLDWNSGKYYYVDAWYAKESIPSADPDPDPQPSVESIVLKFNGTGNAGSDASKAFDADVAAIFDAASAPYVASVETATRVYAGRPISDDNSSVKFGTSSAAGTLEFTLAQAIEVDSIIVNATQYGNNAAEVTINGTKFDLTAGNKKPQDCKITPEGEVSTISIVQSGSERIYLRNVRIYPKTQGGGDDPQPETQTVYLNGGGSALWNQADAEFFAHTWGGAEAVAVKMTLVEGDVYSAAIPADNANVVFVRMAPESSAIDWDNCWNKTEDLTIEGENNLYTITAWGEGTKVCAGAWSVYGEGGGDTPEPEELPVVKIAGSWDEGWDQHVMDVAEDSLTASFTMNLEAGNYDFKIVKDGKWLTKYGTSGPNGDQYGINRIWNHADHVNIDAEGAPNFYLEADVTGEYTFTWTFADDSLSVDFPAAPKFYVTGNAALVGEEKQWTPGIIPSENDTLVLDLEAGNQYMLKVTLGNDWTHGVLGYDALSEKPTGIIRGEGDDDDNICFTLAEAGQVKVVYIKGAGEEYTFKMFGNFYIAPVEKDSIFFVNVADWAAVRVHLWGGSAAGTEWPGVEMTKEAEQINGHDVYKFVADEGAYANCIFSDKGNNQTGNLDWNSGKYYYVDAWYAKEDIPTVQPEDVVFTVNVPEGTDSVFIAGNFNEWTFEKMALVEGQENKYTITKNIVKDGIEYKYAAGRDWAYVEVFEGNRTAWAELDEVTAWKAVPQPVVPVEMKDLEIVAEGEWAAEGEKLGVWAWVDGNDGAWYATAVENEKLMAHIPAVCDKVIVARFAADDELDWNNKLAQTSDLDFNECAKLYLATAGANWCAPVPAFEPHDFFITGNAALVGEELAWNPNAIPVDGTSKVLHLGAGTYEMKIVLDNCGASNCQQWFGCERLSDEQVEGVACSKVGNIEFALAGEEDVTVTVDLTDTIITLTGNFYNIQMVDIRLVLSPEWAMDNAKFAAVTWRDGQEMENDGVLTDWFVGTGDTVVGQIPEDATQIAFARFAPEAETPSLDPNDGNFWNHSDKLIIEPSLIYTIMGGNVEGRDFCPGYWGEKPDFIADGYFLLGTFNDWTADEAYQFGLIDEEGQRKVTAALAVDDHLKVAKFDRGYRVQWFPAEAGDYIVDADHAGSAQDVYFREDYGGADDWHAHCIYVVENSATAIDNTAVDAKAVKMLKNGMILIIKGDKTYNIMGQIVK